MEARVHTNDRHDLGNFYGDDDEQSSDNESCVSDGDYYEKLFGGDPDLVALDKDNAVRNIVQSKFMLCLGEMSNTSTIMAIHKKIWSDFRSGRGRRGCFEVFRQGLKMKNNGSDAGMKFAWYGTSKERVAKIMSHGFSHKDIYDGVFGDGVYLSPVDSPLDQRFNNSCAIDDDGLMHVVLCRVLLDEDQYILADSDSSKSDSTSEDSNIENDDEDNNVVSPNMYVVRSSKMNTHILPEYVISFKTRLATSCFEGAFRVSSPLKSARVHLKTPKSPRLPFSNLISELAKFLPQKRVNLIKKQHMNFKEHKITRNELIKSLKGLAGVDLLVAIVKYCGEKDSGCLLQRPPHPLMRSIGSKKYGLYGCARERMQRK